MALANVLANLIRNVWSNIIIFCGHFPAGVHHFTAAEVEGETRARWYVRQLMGSCNISGGRLFHVLSGNLSHQIEHHLFPDMPSNRYPEVSRPESAPSRRAMGCTLQHRFSHPPVRHDDGHHLATGVSRRGRHGHHDLNPPLTEPRLSERRVHVRVRVSPATGGKPHGDDVVGGESLDQYDLTELLARSGMASIFKALDRESGATVALKIPHLQFESDIVFHERFRREEDIGKRLEHPSIVRVLSPRQKSRMYLAMEYVEGTSLRAMMQAKKRLPVDQALDIARQISAALVYLHGLKVVHRDLKPENILVTAEGQVKLLDFGIALDEVGRRLTWAGLSATIGTPDYMAPEQIGGRRGDTRTDVYALGTILYEMLTGELPFQAPNAQAMMRAKTSSGP